MMDVKQFKKGVLALIERIRDIEQNEPGYDVYEYEDPDLSDLEEYIKNGNIEKDVELMQMLNEIFSSLEEEGDEEE